MYHKDTKPSVSFEFFPPSNPKAHDNLWLAIDKLAPLKPDFISVTYGAGGTTRERTHDTLKKIIETTNLKPAAHLTCVSASKSDVNSVIESYCQIGVNHIVALRGDMPEGINAPFKAHPQGYESSIELIAGIKKIKSHMDITVSAYPERHPNSPTWDIEIDFLKRKIDAGATRAITQFFFYNDLFESYMDKIIAAGITIPIIPGIVPITNFEQTKKFALKTGASVPKSLEKRFEGLEDELEIRQLIGMSYALEQVQDLQKRGINQFHFYTMNKAELVYALCHSLGLRVSV
jgi:methylenetetrahydrofolate reductase (NADPH)